jgi:hypothetical protein
MFFIVCALLLFCVLLVLFGAFWFLEYLEKTQEENPAKAKLQLVLFCIFGVCGMVAVKGLVSIGDDFGGLDFGGLCNELANVGIGFFTLFGFICGAFYIVHIRLAKLEKNAK